MLRNDDASKHIMDCFIRCGHSAESNLRNKEAIDCLIRYGHSAVYILRNEDASNVRTWIRVAGILQFVFRGMAMRTKHI